MKIVYFSVTGQTRLFLQKAKLESDAIEITENYPDIEMEDTYILFVPSYVEEHNGVMKSQDIVDPIFEFMDVPGNPELCKGIIGSGNRNFAQLYLGTAKELSEKYNIPILYDYEMNGTSTDVEAVKELISKL